MQVMVEAPAPVDITLRTVSPLRFNAVVNSSVTARVRFADGCC